MIKSRGRDHDVCFVDLRWHGKLKKIPSAMNRILEHVDTNSQSHEITCWCKLPTQRNYSWIWWNKAINSHVWIVHWASPFFLRHRNIWVNFLWCENDLQLGRLMFEVQVYMQHKHWGCHQPVQLVARSTAQFSSPAGSSAQSAGKVVASQCSAVCQTCSPSLWASEHRPSS